MLLYFFSVFSLAVFLWAMLPEIKCMMMMMMMMIGAAGKMVNSISHDLGGGRRGFMPPL